MSRRRAGGAGLGGIKTAPLRMAEFTIGQDFGLKPGERVSARCVAGGNVRKHAARGRVPFDVAKNEFLNIRASQVGAPATGATFVRGEGAWLGGREPSFLGQVIYDGRAERSPSKFRSNMRAMCEALACGLAQREVLLRLSGPEGVKFSRCTPTGAPKP